MGRGRLTDELGLGRGVGANEVNVAEIASGQRVGRGQPALGAAGRLCSPLQAPPGFPVTFSFLTLSTVTVCLSPQLSRLEKHIRFLSPSCRLCCFPPLRCVCLSSPSGHLPEAGLWRALQSRPCFQEAPGVGADTQEDCQMARRGRREREDPRVQRFSGEIHFCANCLLSPEGRSVQGRRYHGTVPAVAVVTCWPAPDSG